MEETVRIRLPLDQTWELVADREAQQRWLGRGALLQPVAGSRVQLNHEAGVWRVGSVRAVRAGQAIECELARSLHWPGGQGTTQLTITIERHARSGCRVRVTEEGLPENDLDPFPHTDSTAFWRPALERLRDLANRVRDRKRRPRQAVIVIHGIGEQEPGATLRSFVSGCFGRARRSWSKPDRASKLFELRRITLGATDRQERPTTDVFELYWAHVIRDTTLGHVSGWVRQILLRFPVPKKYRSVWACAWLAILGTLAFAVARMGGWWANWASFTVVGGVLALVGTWLWRLTGKGFVLHSLGDAVRYLTPRPSNIAHRQAIREAGVDLLHNLHERGNFDRIVIVGHSLGSVIAYDVITHYWIRTHQAHLGLPSVRNTGITAVERGLGETDLDSAQSLQHSAWRQARLNSQPWLVTDLVTVGSPLSSADFLMARSAAEFERAKQDRELPTCPPVAEELGGKQRVSFDRAYDDRHGGQDRQLSVPHHAAPFALTRWTNLHFHTGLLGDPIGGPVAPQFGPWVRDVELRRPAGRRAFLHSTYWNRAESNDHVEALLAALRLDSGRDLLAQLERHSPLMYLGGSPSAE